MFIVRRVCGIGAKWCFKKDGYFRGGAKSGEILNARKILTVWTESD